MSKTADLPDTIAVFPLGGALLLPRARLPLHIFEPRYLQMFDDALKTPERLIGMIQPHEVPGRNGHGMQKLRCRARLNQFTETQDNRYLVTLTGISRFRVLSEVDGFTPYRRCKVDWSGFDRDRGASEGDKGFERVRFLDLLGRYFEVRGLSADWETLKEADDELLLNSLSMMLDFEPEDKQALLEAPSLSTRRETLVTLIEYAMRSGPEGDVMQ